MIIDFHTHTFPDKIASSAIDKLKKASHTYAFTDGTERGLCASMDKAGIDLSVVLPVATNPDKVAQINEISYTNNLKQNKLFYLGCMHPDCSDYANELRRISSLGLKGIKIHPVYQNTDIDDIRFLRILYEAASSGLFVITHSGYDIGFPGAVNCSPDMVKNVIKEIGNITLVLAHMGFWRSWERSKELAEYKNVYIDTSFSCGRMTPSDSFYGEKELELMSKEQFSDIVSAFGNDRVIFGSDSPWASQADYKNLILSIEDDVRIFSDNARRILKI